MSGRSKKYSPLVTNMSRQQLEVYLLLKENLGRETHIDEITEKAGLNIRSYTERITELRHRRYAIKNTRKNHYVLVSEPDQSYEQVRFIWSEAKKRGYVRLMVRCEQRIQADRELRENVSKYLVQEGV